jgi:hypothetical protein
MGLRQEDATMATQHDSAEARLAHCLAEARAASRADAIEVTTYLDSARTRSPGDYRSAIPRAPGARGLTLGWSAWTPADEAHAPLWPMRWVRRLDGWQPGVLPLYLRRARTEQDRCTAWCAKHD